GLTVEDGSVTLTGGTLNMNGSTATFTVPTSLSIGSVISGSSTLVKMGSGTLTLSNTTNSYTGGMTISAGTVILSGPGSLGDSGGTQSSQTVTLNGGALQNSITANFSTNRG